MGIIEVFNDVLVLLLVNLEDYGFDGRIAFNEDAWYRRSVGNSGGNGDVGYLLRLWASLGDGQGRKGYGFRCYGSNRRSQGGVQVLAGNRETLCWGLEGSSIQ